MHHQIILILSKVQDQPVDQWILPISFITIRMLIVHPSQKTSRQNQCKKSNSTRLKINSLETQLTSKKQDHKVGMDRMRIPSWINGINKSQPLWVGSVGAIYQNKYQQDLGRETLHQYKLTLQKQGRKQLGRWRQFMIQSTRRTHLGRIMKVSRRTGTRASNKKTQTESMIQTSLHLNLINSVCHTNQ